MQKIYFHNHLFIKNWISKYQSWQTLVEFFLNIFLLNCSCFYCTKITRNDLKHVDTMRIVSFGAMITLFRISVQSTRFCFTGQRVQLDNCPSQCGRNCARVPQKWRCRLFQVWQKESKSCIFLKSEKFKASHICEFRSDLGVGHFPAGYYRPCEKLLIEQRQGWGNLITKDCPKYSKPNPD